MKKILLVCAALACMATSPVPAQDAAVKKIIEMGQNCLLYTSDAADD